MQKILTQSPAIEVTPLTHNELLDIYYNHQLTELTLSRLSSLSPALIFNSDHLTRDDLLLSYIEVGVVALATSAIY